MTSTSDRGKLHRQIDLSDPRAPTKSSNSSSDVSIPLHRQQLLKWNGWGYKDSQFLHDEKNHVISFTGNRYRIGNKRLPHMRDWAVKTLHAELDKPIAFQPEIPEDQYPKPVLVPHFMASLKNTSIKFSLTGMDRLFRAHGHTMHEAFILTNSMFKRIPDIVVWPTKTADVEMIVRLASQHNVVIIPFGGGTSVTGGLECPEHETRMIVSLDTSQMNRCIWIDEENLTGRFEAGIIGQDLERILANHGLCTGHEPDSFEFSSLGGWVATRASGMKKNIYGNIEDLLIHVTMVTPRGIVERNSHAPRVSCGPDVNNFVLGSEGTLGVITEVTLKLRPLPELRKYGSIIFPDFESGIKFMREVAKQRLRPASVRLLDNQQFIFGQALKPEAESLITSILDTLKKTYITLLKGFDVQKMCVVTLLLEGRKEEVEREEGKILSIGTEFGGLSAGEENGKRGYMLTFVIAYIRDMGMRYGILAESFETSIPWSGCSDLCKSVKHRIQEEAKRFRLKKPMLITCRVTQGYDAGACIYFYFAFNYQNGFHDDAPTTDPLLVYEAIEDAAREEILALGGSLSHHHGIGKIRKRWMKQAVSEVGVGVIRSIKEYLDPQNIFANGNLVNFKSKL